MFAPALHDSLTTLRSTSTVPLVTEVCDVQSPVKKVKVTLPVNGIPAMAPETVALLCTLEPSAIEEPLVITLWSALCSSVAVVVFFGPTVKGSQADVDLLYFAAPL